MGFSALLCILFLPAAARAAESFFNAGVAPSRSQCGKSVSAAEANRELFAAQTALETAKGTGATAKALARVTRAQELYSLSFACANLRGKGPEEQSEPEFKQELPDLGSRARPAARVEGTIAGMAPPDYKPFEAAEAGSAPGIRYTPPPGYANASDKRRWKKRRSSSEEEATEAREPTPSAPAPVRGGPGTDAQPVSDGARPLLTRPAVAEAPGAQLEALGAQRGEPERWVRSAERRLEFGDRAGALMDAERALAAAPGEGSAHRLKAQVLCSLGRFEEARLEALRARELSPQDPGVHEVLAWALANLGDAAGAEASASRALELDSNNAFAYSIRAYARQRLGRTQDAVADLAQAAARNPVYKAQHAAAQAGQALAAPQPPSVRKASERKPSEEPPSGPPLWPAVAAVTLILGLLGACAFFVLRPPAPPPAAES